eukprot:TRINITY_DN2354_c0_g1_i1.p1 TRINITY_DN2354_c0_g1~~TRINITY_DN2354_c0_g1_i1.p1  ORF type:complete len:416 (+),score=85.55 TRINITY_DN2354_c0_g1_i1:49-1296(+)
MKKTSTTNVAPTARTAVPTRAALAEITNTAAAIVAQQIDGKKAVTARAVAPAVAPTGVAAGGVARRTRAAVAAGAALSQTQTQTQHAHHHAVEVHQEQHFISANAATSGVYDGSVVRPAAVEQHDEEMEVVSNAPIGYGYQDRPANIEDIDEGDVHDPIFCSEYVKEIFTYLLQKEVSDRVDCTYLTRQVELSERMRSILVDWMAEVHIKFKLLSETLFLSVNIVDKYLSRVLVEKEKLQLVGIAAMLIASKFEEIYAVEVNDFVYISDNAFTKEEILSMERAILYELNFVLSSPSPLHFLRRWSKSAHSDSTTHTLAKYLTELSLVDYKLLSFLPSVVAAGAVYLARRMTDKSPYWNQTIEFYTGIREAEVIPAARCLNELLLRQPKSSLKATRRKYEGPRLLEVAKIPPLHPF